ncbi:MAG TPA: CDP-diacylglycerol--glycerol-3-phosphate 3-phosphatidyltransferase [Candidatus Aphodousia gallistercoris]|nr:CDP-diacylglycerol--glycerol-3-phosphate 3-phosphatidyltransferase [Candidatus Aphodousia gallistercoris]
MKRQRLPINVPMILTWARIALIPLIIGVFYIPDHILSPFMQNVWATVIFVVAALTDAFDGFIARRYNMESAIGAFLDTSADKLMVCAALIVLLDFNRVDMLVALIIIGREITVTALREWMAKVGAAARVKVNWFGKIKAIAQMVAIPMLLFYEPFLGISMYWLGTILIYVAAFLTIYSMIVYLRAAGPYLSSDTPVKQK